MSHTARDKKRLLSRVRRIRGQVEAVERALESEAGCDTVMHLIAAVRGATTGLMNEVIEEHVRSHLVDIDAPAGRPSEAVEQLVGVLRAYLK